MKKENSGLSSNMGLPDKHFDFHNNSKSAAIVTPPLFPPEKKS